MDEFQEAKRDARIARRVALVSACVAVGAFVTGMELAPVKSTTVVVVITFVLACSVSVAPVALLMWVAASDHTRENRIESLRNKVAWGHWASKELEKMNAHESHPMTRQHEADADNAFHAGRE